MIHKVQALAVGLLSAFSGFATIYSSSSSTAKINTQFVDGENLSSTMTIEYGSVTDEGCKITLNGTELLSSTNKHGSYVWQPRKTGVNTLVLSEGNVSTTSKVNVEKLSYAVPPTPNPPMSKVSTISITPTTRDFELGGGGGAIITSGSGTWTAAVSDPWITLNATSGSAGYPVAYTVSASTNVGQRVGYVYVSGYTHTVTQNGYEADVSPTQVECERDGVTNGKITLDTTGRWAWDAHPNVDWISVSPTHGVGSGTVTYQVAPYYDVSTRSGTITVGDKTVTVFQYGSRMKLSEYSSNQDYLTHVIPIVVDALAVTTWSVTPNASWISVVDGGNGRGGDTVSIAIGENPSYKARTGTVTIGTETFTVTQAGRTVLDFSVNPTTANASVTGGNGLLAVLATPDLPWTAASGANWLTLQNGTASGAGNGNIVFVASPNPTLSKRMGKITVTPASGSGLSAKTCTVTQPAAIASISSTGYEFEASGEATEVEVTVDDIVQWSISESLDWITIDGSTSRTGPGKVRISASANNTVYPKSGTVTIAGKKFSVSQKARGVQLEYDSIVFKTDGGFESFSVHPDGSVSWNAVASDPTWITVFGTTSGTGDAEVEYVISPYVGNGTPRTGWIEVGDQKVYIMQRSYDLDISPRAAQVNGNSGAGEIGVSAGVNDIWNAIVTEPWITIVTGYDAGTGNGTVRFTYTENNTGKTRTGKIIVAGEVYKLEQAARILVKVSASVDGHGSVSGAGSYTLGETATLTAVADDGYEFLYWTGDAGEKMQNPLVLTADVAKSVTAHFAALTPEFTSVESSTDGVLLKWNCLAWAKQYKIYRAPTGEMPSAALVTITADSSCTYLDESGELEQPYWYWVEAIGETDTTECKQAVSGAKQKPIVISAITYTNLRGATHTNPDSYEEGSSVAFTPPGAVTGYTFAGWTPAAITADMTGAITVSASWTANGYSVKYHANGGSGTMDDTAFTYDVEGRIGTNCFVRSGYVFAGWAMEEDGPAVYEAGQKVSNLTSNQNGVIELYAVWEVEVIAAPMVTPSDGTVFTTESCLVTLSCANEGAVIYYSTKGTPRQTAAYLYSGPFEITDTTTIKAIAVKGDAKSEYATVTITKRVLTLPEVIDATNLVVTTGGDASWIPVVDSAAKTAGECAVSGAMESADDANGNESWMEVSVDGPGTLTFWWKVDCEWADSGDCSWDRLMYFVDGADVDEDRIDGFVDWEQKTVTFTTPGTHSVRWVYHKDDYDEEDAVCADCGWVDGVVWTPSAVAATETTTTPVPVKYAWLEKYYAALSGASAPAYESKAFEKGANGLVVWESYVAGLDPTDEKSKFTASITMGSDGKPVITWIPDFSEASGAERRVYKTLGKAGIGDKDWTEVNDANRAGMRFFKVTVELP